MTTRWLIYRAESGTLQGWLGTVRSDAIIAMDSTGESVAGPGDVPWGVLAVVALSSWIVRIPTPRRAAAERLMGEVRQWIDAGEGDLDVNEWLKRGDA